MIAAIVGVFRVCFRRCGCGKAGRGKGAHSARACPVGGRPRPRRRRIHDRLLFAYHRDTDSFAFPFESQARRHLLPDRLAGLGVPDGPLRGDLAEGRPVVLADGRNIDPEDVLGPPEGRKKLVVVGDTETTNGLTCLMIRPGTFRAMMAVWQCGRKRTKCCDACKTAD